MMRWIVGLSLLVAACNTATESGHLDEVPADLTVVGCYALDLEEWDPPLRQALPGLPEVVELKADLGLHALERNRRLARPNPDFGLGAYAFSWWEPLGGDSLSMVWSTGYKGVELRLAKGDQGLRGYAEAFFEQPGAVIIAEHPAGPSKAEARLERVECRY